MKIALVSEWIDPWRGGAETSTWQFLHHLISADIEVHLFTRSRPSPIPGLVVHTVSGAAMSRTRKTVTFMHRAERMIASQPVDLVHAISPCRSADVYQPRGGTVAESIERNLALRHNGAARSLKKCMNQFNFKQRYMLALERRLLRPGRGPVVVALSDYVVEQLRRHYDLPNARIRRIYNGIDPDPSSDMERARDRAEIRREFGIGEQALLVILIAHNFRLKGVRSWLEAMSLLAKRGGHDVRSLVIGKGDSESWHALAARLGISGALTFIGPTDRVAAFRHAADVLVHPTFYDPCSRVVLESLTGGLPCITTRYDGASEMIRDGVSGFVLDDPRDVEGLAKRVERLCDPAVRQRFARASIELDPDLSMRRHTEEMMALYEQLADGRKTR